MIDDALLDRIVKGSPIRGQYLSRALWSYLGKEHPSREQGKSRDLKTLTHFWIAQETERDEGSYRSILYSQFVHFLVFIFFLILKYPFLVNSKHLYNVRCEMSS